MIMKHTRHILQTIAVAVALLAAGQGAWAQSNSATFPVNVTFQGLMNNGKYAYVITSGLHTPPYSYGPQNDVNNLGYVDFSEQVFDIGSADIPLTMTVRGSFSFPTTTGDATVYGTNAKLVFTSGSKYITAVSVSTYSGTPVSVESITETVFKREVFMLQNTTFGKVTLTMATHTPFDDAATIGGIEDTYLDDGVNQPVPTVTYQEGSGPAITLTEGVDYTVSYSIGSTGGTVTVTGMGQYLGSTSKSYSIRQLQLSDFNQLGYGCYEIATKQDLDNLSKYVNNGNNCQGVTFRQTAAIDLGAQDVWNDPTSGSGDTFSSIGGYGNSFQGTYDGGGYTISGIRILKKGTSNTGSSQGLFGFLGSAGTVKNVVLANARIFAFSNTGGIVGYNIGTVEDCTVGSDVGIYHNQQAVNFGGIAGNNAGGTIRRCTSSATVKDQDGYKSIISGGIAGCMTSGSISNCIAFDAVIASGQDPGGAIVGSKTGGTLTANYYYNCNVNNSYTNVGTGSGDESGAVSVHTVTPESGVSATATGDESVVIGGQTCFVAGSTVSLSGTYNGTPPEGNTFAGFTIRYSGSTIDLGPTGGDFQMPAADATVTHRFITLEWEGSGTEDDPYTISLATQLDLLAQRVNGGNDYEGKFFVLDADITYGHGTADDENKFTPIGKSMREFAGTFDGQGHKVSGIRIYKDGKNDTQLGLFGSLSYGVVKNVFLSDARISGRESVGGIVGWVGAKATVQNCHVDGTVSVHGLSDNSILGGIVGSLQQGTVEACTSAARITGSSNNSTDSGSIIGEVQMNTSSVIMKNCFAIGSVISASGKCGALIGFNQSAYVYNNYYYNCSVNSASENIGCGRRVTGDPGDISAGDGAVRTIALAARPAEIGAQIASYPDGLTVYEHGVCWKGTYYLRHDLEGSAQTLTLTQGAKDGVSAWWGTFYHGSMRYSLPEGAAAYTMDSSKHLYRLGDNGRVIPAGVAAVIISDKETITLNYDSGTEEITDHAPDYVNNTLTDGNILHGGPVTLDGEGKVPVPGSDPDVKGFPYVLSVDSSGTIGFRQYTGTDDIPAHKAFYVQ